MGRKILKAAKCSQMSNPSQGSGNGGDRCTEAVAAMIADTYQIPLPGIGKAKHSTEAAMYIFTQMLNKGSNVSALEDSAWIAKWFKNNSGGQVAIGNLPSPSFASVKANIDRNHVAIGVFTNYAQLRLSTGDNPYKWLDHSIVGHVLLIVGYDDSKSTVIVHDPLRADPSGQPADYSWSSMSHAGFTHLCEVVATPLAQSNSLGTFLGNAANNLTTTFGPNDSVTDFCKQLDRMEVITDPFSGVQAQTDSFGPVSFTDPISWAGGVAQNIWANTGHFLFRSLIVLLGIFILFKLASSIIPEAVSGGGGGEDKAQLAQMAMMLA